MDETLKNRILEKAAEHFFRFGYTKSNVDEICGELGISKKTLYRCFETKKSLLDHVVERMMASSEREMEHFLKDSVSFFGQQKQMVYFLGELISRARILLQDLQRHEPEVWEKINQFRKEKFFKKHLQFFLKAQQEGLLRQDISLETGMKILFSMLEAVTDFRQESALSGSPHELIEATFKIFFEGVAVRKCSGHEESNRSNS